MRALPFASNSLIPSDYVLKTIGGPGHLTVAMHHHLQREQQGMGVKAEVGGQQMAASNSALNDGSRKQKSWRILGGRCMALRPSIIMHNDW